MKIYTKTGDDGTTGLVGGQRTRKDDLRIQCAGAVDELNAALGLAAVGVGSGPIGAALANVQHDLFVVGSHLATAGGEAGARARASLPPLTEAMINRLETQIDSAQTTLPTLREFILPGGTELASRLHVARTICRRAERLVVTLAGEQTVETSLLVYLNRLSDWLFVHARLANQLAGAGDVTWKKEG